MVVSGLCVVVSGLVMATICGFLRSFVAVVASDTDAVHSLLMVSSKVRFGLFDVFVR